MKKRAVRKHGRRKTPPGWQAAFLTYLRERGSVSGACRAAKVRSATAYRIRRADSSFAARWDAALVEARDRLGEDAFRTVHRVKLFGWREPFLARLRERGVVLLACRAAHVQTWTVRRARAADAGFAAQWDAALAEARLRMGINPPRPAPRGWQRVFLRRLREAGIVNEACRAAQIGSSTAYRLRRANPSFAARWDAALDEARERLGENAWRRARREAAPHWRKVFLARLRELGCVRKACDAARVRNPWAYHVRAADARFAAEWALALDEGWDRLEEEARRRAMGIPRPVYYKGVKCGENIEYSDKLLMFLLELWRPEVYGKLPRRRTGE